MNENPGREEMERLERTVQRVFARVSVLEARVNDLERELLARNGRTLHEVEWHSRLEGLRRTA
ncbi:MAG: hypothetical protein IPF53_08395 [Blastocatellia bacterium]|jgi:hypothetical protein|nr:hypothetical protein [Blastocatellia bacterium]MBK6427246.1 hypothetical protein [Blastocatellia bacterium]